MCKKQEDGYDTDDNLRRDLLRSVLAIIFISSAASPSREPFV